jgi:L-alanine-DL-glutamate epimerase-like enolase superfamily enzyme
MPTITRIEICQVDLEPHGPRSDAIQTFSRQETPMLRLFCDDGSAGAGYSYTIGTGGSSVVALLRDHMAPRLLGRDPSMVEEIWKELFFHTHATSMGAITSIALCVVDMALWDLRCKRAQLRPHYPLARAHAQRLCGAVAAARPRNRLGLGCRRAPAHSTTDPVECLIDPGAALPRLIRCR